MGEHLLEGLHRENLVKFLVGSAALAETVLREVCTIAQFPLTVIDLGVCTESIEVEDKLPKDRKATQCILFTNAENSDAPIKKILRRGKYLRFGASKYPTNWMFYAQISSEQAIKELLPLKLFLDTCWIPVSNYTDVGSISRLNVFDQTEREKPMLTREIVINTCFGGFSLSGLALKELVKRDAACIRTYTEEEYYGMSKAEYDSKWPCLSNQQVEDLGDGFQCGEISRHIQKDALLYCLEDEDKIATRTDKDLIEVVKLLGEQANGMCAELEVIEIPFDVDVTIDEYDGSEHVAEVHRTWGSQKNSFEDDSQTEETKEETDESSK